MTRDELLKRHCAPTTFAVDAATLAFTLAALPEWSVDDDELVRTYRFPDFHQVMDFMNALAPMIHAEDHHPTAILGYNTVELRYCTHSAGHTISENDLICAAKADAILDGMARP